MGSLSHPSRGSVGCGWAGERRREERESEWERLVGDGQPVWGEEAREGGVNCRGGSTEVFQ